MSALDDVLEAVETAEAQAYCDLCAERALATVTAVSMGMRFDVNACPDHVAPAYTDEIVDDVLRRLLAANPVISDEDLSSCRTILVRMVPSSLAYMARRGWV